MGGGCFKKGGEVGQWDQGFESYDEGQDPNVTSSVRIGKQYGVSVLASPSIHSSGIAKGGRGCIALGTTQC